VGQGDVRAASRHRDVLSDDEFSRLADKVESKVLVKHELSEDEDFSRLADEVERRLFEQMEFSELADRVESLLVERQEQKDVLETFHILSVGIVGTGRSSFLNTLFDDEVFKVSGGQLQGTRVHEFATRPKVQVDDWAVSISCIDSKGLRRDRKVTEKELLENLKSLMNPLRLFPNQGISHIFFTLDVENRSDIANVENLLMLTQVYRPLLPICYLCITKWNTNGVMKAWNERLYSYCKAKRQKKTGVQIPPPAPKDMLEDYLNYLDTNMKFDCVLKKLKTLLDIFEDRVIWGYNLDTIQREDRAENELPPYVDYLYEFYRSQCLSKLSKSTMVSMKNVLL